ncbi:hypothetical protein OAF54_02865 [bacterium]|nr:hypothetical protein [bacterium]
MNPNKNWPRWVFASLSRHFKDACDEANIPLFIEGQHRNTLKLKDFAELRMDGPTFLQVSKGCWHLKVEINILIQSSMDDKNYHRIHQNVGEVAAMFKDALIAYKKGSGEDDDQSAFGCLQIIQNKASRDYLEINHFGQIDKKTNLVQATVEGHYRMILQGD